jgi:hypothetical protein
VRRRAQSVRELAACARDWIVEIQDITPQVHATRGLSSGGPAALTMPVEAVYPIAGGT